jgi:hypothetical protein
MSYSRIPIASNVVLQGILSNSYIGETISIVMQRTCANRSIPTSCGSIKHRPSPDGNIGEAIGIVQGRGTDGSVIIARCILI